MSPVRSLFRFSPSVCLALLVASLLSASPAQAVITHVQQASNSDVSSATYTSFSATFASASTAGNAIILGVTYGNTDPAITVTDSQGNIYAKAIKTYDAGHRQGVAIFYSINILGGASHTVTVNFSAPVAYLALGIHEYSGVASLDVTSGSIGNGTSISSGSATSTVGGDLLCGATAEDNVGHGDTFTAGSGFTKRVDLGIQAGFADEDSIQYAAGAAAATFTLSPDLGWIADMAAFRASTAGGGGGPSITNVSPTSGPVGTSVTITGQHFGATQSSSAVTFNGTPAAITTWSDTQIVAVVQNGSTTGNVVVTVAGVASNRVSFTVLPPSTPISHVQQASNSDITGSTYSSFGATLPSATTSGNAVILGVTYGNADVTIAGTDSHGNSYAQAIKTYDPRHNQGCAILYSTNIAGGAAPTVTVNFSAPVAYLALGVHEYTAISVLDVTSGNMGSGVSPSSGSATTTSNGDLIFGCGVEDAFGHGDTFTAAAGFTKRVDLGNAAAYADEDEILPLAGPAAITWSLSPAGLDWIADMAAFKPSPNALPSISGAIPLTVVAGQRVTISGSGFGGSQGAGSVVLGDTNGAVVSWSDSKIVAAVAANAHSGVIQVFQSGVGSNQFPLSIVVPNSLTALAFPTPNASGWNNSNVTVSFTCTSGNVSIPNCLNPQTISTEGANQVITGTIAGSSGNLTASVTLNIDKTLPALSVTSPADDAVFSATPVTVTGALSDALSGLSALTCNGVSATPSGGSFSCNISLSLGVNLIVVRATDIAGNVAASSFHVTLSGALPAPNSLQVTPANVNMLIGETKQFTAVDQGGRPRSDATWTVSNTSLASIDTASSPTLTAKAAGQVTLTAAVGSVTAQTQVTIFSGSSLPAGTVRWSLPTTPGYTPLGILQAKPTDGGPDLYSLEWNGSGDGSSLVRAVTGDGQRLWAAVLPPGHTPTAMSDGNGGVLVNLHPFNQSGAFNPIVDLDARTGAQLSEYDTWLGQCCGAIGQDGKAYFYEFYGTNPSLIPGVYLPSALTVLDGNTGALVARYQDIGLQDTETGSDGTHLFGYPLPSGFTIAPDGTLLGWTTTVDFSFLSSASFKQTSYLVRIPPGGSPILTPLHTWTSFLPGQENYSIGPNAYFSLPGTVPKPILASRVIPDGQGGALFFWYDQVSTQGGSFAANHQVHITHVSSDSTANDFVPAAPFGQLTPNLDTLAPIVLGENGVAFASDSQTLLAFNVPTLTPLWTYSSSGGLQVIAATADGGLVVLNGSDIVQLDAQGTATTISAGVGYSGNSWTGNWYSTLSGAVSQTALSPIRWATSYAAMPSGNPSGTGAFSGVLEAVEGMPVFGFPSWGPSCTLGTNKVPLGGDALQQYNDTKQKLLNGGYLTCPSCSAFFNADPFRAGYFNQLTDAVTRQIPYDGPQTTISQYDAGMLSPTKAATNPTAVSIMKKVPVCALFLPFRGPNGTVPPTGLVTAASQITPPTNGPATDVYIHTSAKALKFLTQGTILHEVLHNLTGLEDFLDLDERTGVQPPFDLKTLVGIETSPGVDPKPGTTIDITKQLEVKGCAGTN